MKKTNKLRDEFNSTAKELESGIRCIGLGPRLEFSYKNIHGKEDEEVKTLFMQEVIKREVFFIWNMLPSYKLSDEDIKYTLGVFKEALKITVNAEKENKVKDMLGGGELQLLSYKLFDNMIG